VPVEDFQYKFTLCTWATTEETSSCGSVANRAFDFNDSDASFTATDTVAAWDGVGSC
jgi:alpha-amylase